MSDPAVEAAQRLVPEAFGTRTELSSPNSVRGVAAVAAAREALKPVRELHADLAEFAAQATNPDFAIGIRHALGKLAPLIYTTEELEGHG